MQKPEVRAFKNELRNYDYYSGQVVVFAHLVEICYERLGGVRGIDPGKEPSHVMPNKDLEYKLRDDIERYEARLRLVESKIRYIDMILDRMDLPIRQAVIMVYARGSHVESVSEEYFLSPNGLMKRMNKAIEEALHGQDTADL